jgi:hypothetical protein
MPLVLDPERYARATLVVLARELTEGLAEIREMTLSPRGRVLDPASLVTARELIDSAVARLGRSDERPNAEIAADVNLAYATLLAALDLVKSHTEVPRVPAPRKAP